MVSKGAHECSEERVPVGDTEALSHAGPVFVSATNFHIKTSTSDTSTKRSTYPSRWWEPIGLLCTRVSSKSAQGLTSLLRQGGDALGSSQQGVVQKRLRKSRLLAHACTRNDAPGFCTWLLQCPQTRLCLPIALSHLCTAESLQVSEAGNTPQFTSKYRVHKALCGRQRSYRPRSPYRKLCSGRSPLHWSRRSVLEQGRGISAPLRRYSARLPAKTWFRPYPVKQAQAGWSHFYPATKTFCMRRSFSETRTP